MTLPNPPQRYRMPAEWERHEATWLSWPYNTLTWGEHLEGAECTFCEIIAALLPHEKVHLLVPSEEVEKRALHLLADKGTSKEQLHVHTIETGDVWFRDFGPLFIVSDKGKQRELAWTKWTYNALGGKYEDLLIGNDVPERMPLQKLKRFDGGIVLEGGSIDVNGKGSLLTTESCLLSFDRNPDLSREEIEQKLKDCLGITNILWLSSGIAGDDTTGHIDDIARFVGQSTVVAAVEEDPLDENYAPLQENLKRLLSMHDERGTPLRVVQLPMPRPFIVNGRRMAASYANFYIANGVILVPLYAQPEDKKALSILQECFPNREIIGIDCRELIYGYGAIHCCTMQQPSQ